MTIPTLGRIPFLLHRLGHRLYARGLVGSPKFQIYIPKKKPKKIESET